MSNTLNIPEVTLTEVIMPGGPNDSRPNPLEPIVIRLRGHADDVAAETDDPDKMALFCSKAQGHPWVKEGSSQKRITFEAKDDTTPAPVDATYIVPHVDYSKFE